MPTTTKKRSRSTRAPRTDRRAPDSSIEADAIDKLASGVKWAAAKVKDPTIATEYFMLVNDLRARAQEMREGAGTKAAAPSTSAQILSDNLYKPRSESGFSADSWDGRKFVTYGDVVDPAPAPRVSIECFTATPPAPRALRCSHCARVHAEGALTYVEFGSPRQGGAALFATESSVTLCVGGCDAAVFRETEARVMETLGSIAPVPLAPIFVNVGRAGGVNASIKQPDFLRR